MAAIGDEQWEQGAASSSWIDLRYDPLTKVERYHWRQQPALLIRTEKNPRGYVVPMQRADIELVHVFLSGLQRD